jgi:serine/threonine protein kinase
MPDVPAGESPGLRIDQLCDRFDDGWRAGRPDRLEDVVRAAPEPLRPGLFRELLAVEREYRAKAGRPLTPGEARDRFAPLGPWADEIVGELLSATRTWTPEFGSTPRERTTAADDRPPAGDRPDDLPAAVGGYPVVGLLGRGGMGAVYAARDDRLGRRVAIKVMRPALAAHPDAKDRFLREARAAAKVEHDHVVPVWQVGEDGGAPFIVMPHLRGESLEDRLKREPVVPPGLAARIAREVALGLAAAHEQGLVHRDVKPGNIWLEGDPTAADPAVQVWRAKVFDFGLARVADGADGLTDPGAVVGTPAYMAPEQADGRPVDARADLFSLGAVLYRMTTGRPAFAGPTLTAILSAIANHDPPPPAEVNPAVPAALSALVMRLLAKNPATRPASARAVADELAAPDRLAPEPPRRRRWFGFTIRINITITVGLALLVGLGLWTASPPRTATDGQPEIRESERRAAGKRTPAPVAYSGSVDLLVGRKDLDGSDIVVPLWDPRALPLKPGDHVKVVAEVSPAAFLYLFWIDETGATVPLYPWSPLAWGTRPESEEALGRVEVRDPRGNWFKVTGDAPGMETLLMLARPDRLGAGDEEVRAWFRGLPRLRFVGEKARAWFENFDLVPADGNRPRSLEYGGEVGAADGPLALQAVLRQRIGSAATFSRAVSFARLGKEGDE